MANKKLLKSITQAAVAVTIALAVFPIAFVANHVYYGHKNWKAKQEANNKQKKEILKD